MCATSLESAIVWRGFRAQKLSEDYSKATQRVTTVLFAIHSECHKLACLGICVSVSVCECTCKHAKANENGSCDRNTMRDAVTGMAIGYKVTHIGSLLANMRLYLKNTHLQCETTATIWNATIEHMILLLLTSGICNSKFFQTNDSCSRSLFLIYSFTPIFWVDDQAVLPASHHWPTDCGLAFLFLPSSLKGSLSWEQKKLTWILNLFISFFIYWNSAQ